MKIANILEVIKKYWLDKKDKVVFLPRSGRLEYMCY